MKSSQTRLRLFHVLWPICLAIGLGAIVGVPGCSPETSGGIGSNTGWMRICDSDAACGSETACMCGICTQECEGTEDCKHLADAVCVDSVVTDTDACSEATTARTCALECNTEDDCPPELSCLEGVCRRSQEEQAESCGKEIQLTIRDFEQTDPDFGLDNGNPFEGCGYVQDELSSDGLPVLTGPLLPGNRPQGLILGTTICTPDDTMRVQFQDANTFDRLYRDDEVLDRSFEHVITFTGDTEELAFEAAGAGGFYPADGRGFQEAVTEHNLYFTAAGHTKFQYRQGDTFSIGIDDDAWIFVNGRLALDLGGVAFKSGELDLDSMSDVLGISPGGTYTMDIFLADRGTMVQSSLQIKTTIDCFTNVVVE